MEPWLRHFIRSHNLGASSILLTNFWWSQQMCCIIQTFKFVAGLAFLRLCTLLTLSFFSGRSDFNLKLTFMRPTGRVIICSLSEIFNTIFQYNIWSVLQQSLINITINHGNIPIARHICVEVFQVHCKRV